jgi:Tfp pilus assembly protein PilF
VVLAAALGGGFYWTRRASQADELLQQAQAALSDYDFETAQARLTAALELQPDAAQSHFLLAQAYRRARREEFELARTHLLAAQQRQWPAAAVALEYALLDFQTHGTMDTREKLLHGYLDDPDVDRRLVFEALVRGCLRAERMDHAGVWLQRWLTAFPDDWYAYLLRGTLRLHTDHAERAVADYTRVLRDRPDSLDVKRRLGLALVQSGSDYARALGYLEEYREHHPDDADVLVGIARCRCVLNQAAAAKPILASVLSAHPGNSDALSALVLAEIDLGDDAEALRLLERLEPLAATPAVDQALAKLWRLEPVLDSRSVPTRLQAVYQLQASVRRRLGQESQARAYEEKLERHNAAVAELLKLPAKLAEEPENVALWRRMAELNLVVGLRDTGVYWLRRVLQADPQDAAARRLRDDHQIDKAVLAPR